MSNLGSGEILVVLVLALIVLGPERLPEAARKIGGVVRQVRQLSNGFQQEVKRAMDFTDGDKPFSPEEARIRPLPDRTGDDDGASDYDTDVRAVNPEPFSATEHDEPDAADADRADRSDDQRAAG